MVVTAAIAKKTRSLKWRFDAVVFGFSDVTCALLVVRAPTGKFHYYR